jgi:DNA-binding GntR family transcriptional regulator
MSAVIRPAPDDDSLAVRAYRLLEEMLVTLRLAPGQLLAEKDLVDRAGIGRTPVREAIQRLSNEGMLTVLPRKGLMVTPLRRSDLGQIVEARRVMERLLVVKAAERATDGQRRALRELALQIEASDHDLAAYFRLDHQLNELLEEASQNRYLVRALAAMQSQCRRLWYQNRERLNLPRAAMLHAGLARAVAERDVTGAIRALDEIIATLEDLVNRLDVLN